MSYIPAQEYSAVSENAEANNVNSDLLNRIRTSSRVVAFYCFVQMVVAGIFLFHGRIFEFCLTALFVSIGLAGVIKRKYRLVIAHFVYSVVVYIFTLVVLVFAILYCDDCQWFEFVIIGLFAVIQAIGLKHSRLLISSLRTLYGVSCCNTEQSCPQEVSIEIKSNPDEPQTSGAPAPAPTAPVMSFYPSTGQYPNFQGMPMQPYSPYGQQPYNPNMQPFNPNMQPVHPSMQAYGPNMYPMMTFPTAPVQPPAYRQ